MAKGGRGGSSRGGKPRTESSRTLQSLIDRAGLKETARRLKVSQKTIAKWISSDVPKSRKFDVHKVKERSDAAKRAVVTRKLRNEIRSELTETLQSFGFSPDWTTGNRRQFANEHYAGIVEAYRKRGFKFKFTKAELAAINKAKRNPDAPAWLQRQETSISPESYVFWLLMSPDRFGIET